MRYLLCERAVLEIQACKSGPSSWFIDESVSSGERRPPAGRRRSSGRAARPNAALFAATDGYLNVATPVDPLFLLVPRLDALRNKARSVVSRRLPTVVASVSRLGGSSQTADSDGVFVEKDAIWHDDACAGYALLRDDKLDGVELATVCDTKGGRRRRRRWLAAAAAVVGGGGALTPLTCAATKLSTFYRLSDDKLRRWLAAKTLAVLDQLRADAALHSYALAATSAAAIGAPPAPGSLARHSAPAHRACAQRRRFA